LSKRFATLAISNQLIASIIKWKIMDKVAFVTVDNSSLNNVAILRLSGVLNNQSSNLYLAGQLA
jgi:hypothetical protein